MGYRFEYEILVGIIFVTIIILFIIATLLEHFFPENKLAKRIDKIIEWIQDNIKI